MPDSANTAEPDLSVYLGGRSFEDAKAEYDEKGFVVFENVLSADELQDITAALSPYMQNDLRGRNDFEGLKSNRVYALAAKSPVFVNLMLHPLALAFAEAELGASCLLSAMLAIKLHPGETVQPWHFDDSCGLSRPRRTTGVSAFWSITDTTEENGATEVIPGSHFWDNEAPAVGLLDAFEDHEIREVDDDPAFRSDAVKLVMPAGSLAIAKGTLWHRGGANRSDQARTIITPQYCAGYMRQLENMVLAVPKDIAANLPKRAQELLGYSIHPPFMGYVDGVHPAKKLNAI